MLLDALLLPLVTPLSRAFLFAPLALALAALVFVLLALFAIAAAMPRHGNGSGHSNVIGGNRIARNDPYIMQPRKYWTGD